MKTRKDDELQTKGCRPTLAVSFRGGIWLRDTSATRHFGIRSTKCQDILDTGQFRQDTAAPVIRLKVGAEVLGAELSCGRSVLLPGMVLRIISLAIIS